MADWDDVLAYTTERKTRIRHKWLGALYYATMLAILVYTVVWQVVLLRGYLLLEPIGGSVGASVEAGGTFAPVSSLAYCAQSGQRTDLLQRPCTSFEPLTESVPTADVGLLVATRLSSVVQLRNASCARFEYGCDEWPTSPVLPTDEYIGDIESALVTIQHSVEPSGASPAGGQAQLPLVDTFTSPAQRTASIVGFGTPPGGWPVTALAHGDVLTVKELMAAAGVDLDARGAGDVTDTPRHAGTTIRVAIEYDASGYTYRAVESRVQRELAAVRPLNATARRADTLRGVQLVFTQTSRVYRFDVRTLLLTLVSGLALLSAAKTVADAFVLYLSPHRKSYRLFITTDTPDFDPDTEAERLLLAKVLARKRRKQSLLVKHAIDPDGPSSAHLLHDAAVAAVADGGGVVG